MERRVIARDEKGGKKGKEERKGLGSEWNSV
jgi:hypothetical protein